MEASHISLFNTYNLSLPKLHQTEGTSGDKIMFITQVSMTYPFSSAQKSSQAAMKYSSIWLEFPRDGSHAVLNKCLLVLSSLLLYFQALSLQGTTASHWAAVSPFLRVTSFSGVYLKSLTQPFLRYDEPT